MFPVIFALTCNWSMRAVEVASDTSVSVAPPLIFRVAAVVMSRVETTLTIPEVMVADVPEEMLSVPIENAVEEEKFCVVAELRVSVRVEPLLIVPLFAKLPDTTRSCPFMLKLLEPFTVKFPFTMVDVL